MMKIRCNNSHIKLFGAILFFQFSAHTAVIAAERSSLQRLFYTPSERHKIDAIRNKTDIDEITAELKNGQSEIAESKGKAINLNTVVIDGYLKREDGQNVIWFNDTSTLTKNSNKNFNIQSRSVAKDGVDVISNNKSLKLKPGQVLEINSGKVNEQYNIADSAAKLSVDK